MSDPWSARFAGPFPAAPLDGEPLLQTDVRSFLGRLDTASLRTLAANHGIVFQEASPSQKRLIDYLGQRLTDRTKLKALLTRVTPEERHALRLLAFRSEPLREELLHQEINNFVGRRGAGKVVATLLASRGLIFPGRDYWQQAYAMPADVAEALTSVFLDELLPQLKHAAAPAAIRDDGLAFVRDVFTFLAGLYREPVPVTQKGTLHKRAVAKLEAQFEGEATARTAGTSPPAVVQSASAAMVALYAGSPFGPRTSLLLDYCGVRELMAETEAGDRVTPSPRVASWLRLSQAQRVQDLYAYCRGRLWLQTPLLARAAEALLSLPPGRWASAAALPQALAETDQGLLQVLQLYLTPSVIWPLVYLGLVQIGAAPEGLVVSPTELGHALQAGTPLPLEPPTEAFYVQPNFEIVAPRTLALAVRWELEQVAALAATGQAATYVLSRETLYRALATGREVEQVLEFLSAHAAAGVPQNVAYSLRDWAAQFGRLSFVDALVLRCDGPALAQELRAQRRLAPFIVGELGPEQLVVKRAGFGQLSKALRQLGYMPRPGVAHPSGPAAPAGRASAPGDGLLQEELPLPPTPDEIAAAPPWDPSASDPESLAWSGLTMSQTQVTFFVTPHPLVRLNRQ